MHYLLTSPMYNLMLREDGAGGIARGQGWRRRGGLLSRDCYLWRAYRLSSLERLEIAYYFGAVRFGTFRIFAETAIGDSRYPYILACSVSYCIFAFWFSYESVHMRNGTFLEMLYTSIVQLSIFLSSGR